MKRSEEKAILRRAIEAYGYDSQIDMAVEEMAELTAALNRFRRGRIDAFAVEEEIADASIMLAQLRLMFDGRRIAACRRRKVERLAKSLEGGGQ